MHTTLSLIMTSEDTKQGGEVEMPKRPTKGKRFVKVVTDKRTGRKKRISYGQKGASIRPGTPKGDSYCARSLGIKKRLSKAKQNDPNTPNNLSRKKWNCKGAKSLPRGKK